MSRIVYVNGEFLPADDAKISVFDRGFLFADAVYEITPVLRGKLIDNAAHLARLQRSLVELAIDAPGSDDELEALQNELISRNELVDGLVYIQVTRGAAERDFVYPKDTPASIVMFTQVKDPTGAPSFQNGIRLITLDDIRWKRRDIKTTQLIAASRAKMEAKARHADDAWLVEDGVITEGSSNNAYIITREGKLITRQLGHEILGGITRQVLLQLVEDTNIELEERPFSVDEAQAAAEAFLTSATTFVTPVIAINSHRIGDGTPGPVTRRLQELYVEKAMSQAIPPKPKRPQ